MSQTKKTVAIIGAGASGLISVKEALQNGVTPTVFEQREDLGGVWNPRTGSSWPGLTTNASKYNVSFGDTPYPPGVQMFPTSSDMFEYLSSYALKWDLRKHIKFGCTVVKATAQRTTPNDKVGSGGWDIVWTNASGQEETCWYDALIVANGMFAIPITPEIKGLSTFRGKVLHSKEYKDPDNFKASKVLVIGGSISGGDISANIATNSHNKVVHCSLRPFWICKKYFEVERESDGKLVSVPFDLVIFNRRLHKEKLKLSLPEVYRMVNTLVAGFCQEQQTNKELGLAIPEEDFSTPILMAINDNYMDVLKAGKILVEVQPIKEISENSVVFQNGTTHEMDTIIFGTGFRPNCSFLDEDILEKLSYDAKSYTMPFVLYLATVHPDVDNFFMVGVNKQPFFITTEQQARWAMRVISNKIQLPPEEVMRGGIEMHNVVRKLKNQNFPYGDSVFHADFIGQHAKTIPDVEKLTSPEFTLEEALNLVIEDETVKEMLESRKQEIAKMFTSQGVGSAHYNLVSDPVQALQIMDEVEHLINSQ